MQSNSNSPKSFARNLFSLLILGGVFLMILVAGFFVKLGAGTNEMTSGISEVNADIPAPPPPPGCGGGSCECGGSGAGC